jgi:hypothetical protein
MKRVKLSLQSHYIEYMLNVLALVVVADSYCCCRAPQLPRLESCHSVTGLRWMANSSEHWTTSVGFCSAANRITGISYSGQEDGRWSYGGRWEETWDRSWLKHMSGVRHEESASITEQSPSCPPQSSSAQSDVIAPWIFASEYHCPRASVLAAPLEEAWGPGMGLSMFLTDKDPVEITTRNRCSYQRHEWILTVQY